MAVQWFGRHQKPILGSFRFTNWAIASPDPIRRGVLDERVGPQRPSSSPSMVGALTSESPDGVRGMATLTSPTTNNLGCVPRLLLNKDVYL